MTVGRAGAVGASVALALFALPGVADAATVCVPVPAAGCDNSAATPQAAADAAAAGDTVRLAPGTFPGVQTAKRLAWVGAGARNTLVEGTASLPEAMRLDHGGSVRALRAVGAPTNVSTTPGVAIRVGVDPPGERRLSLVDVVARGGHGETQTGPPGASGVSIGGGAGPAAELSVLRGHISPGGGFDGGVYQGDPGDDTYNPALSLTATGFRASLAGTSVEAFGGAVRASGGSLTVDRSRLQGGISGGLSLKSGNAQISRSTIDGGTDGLGIASGVATVSNSLIRASGNFFERGRAASVFANSRLIARGSTFYASGMAHAGLLVQGQAVAHLQSSLLYTTAGANADLVVGGGTVSATHSAFRTRQVTGGTAPVPGAGTNIAADPRLDSRLVPLAGSPLVDAGDPSVVSPRELDRAGAPRSLDGDGDCVARPEIGAFERPAVVPCTPRSSGRPSISRLSLRNRTFRPAGVRPRSRRARRAKRGTRFRFRLSEPATVTVSIARLGGGRRVRVRGRIRCNPVTRRNRRARRCTRSRRVGAIRARLGAGRRSVRFLGRVRRQPLRAGSYRATVVAADRQGLRSVPRTIRFRIVR